MGSTVASGAIPATGVPGTGAAAIIPATNVPWPEQSVFAGTRCPVTSAPARTRPASWGTAASTPVSITATVTPAPRVRFHTPAAPSRRCAHGIVRTISVDGGAQPVDSGGLTGGASGWAGAPVGVGVPTGGSPLAGDHDWVRAMSATAVISTVSGRREDPVTASGETRPPRRPGRV